jgi:predicted DNA-binding transcriptional regulator AlpA
MGVYSKPRQPNPECEYFAVKDVATILGVCCQFVYEHLGTEKCPPFVRIGRLIKFPKDQFNRWQQSIGDSNV